jgi:deoxyribodipyrimidine photo-lyase
MSKTPVVMWFRRDLRLADNEALCAAAASGPVLPIFVFDPAFENSGAPRMTFMLRALRALDEEMGGALVIQHGNPVDVLPRVAKAVGASEVYVAKDFAPYGRKRDDDVSAALAAVGARLVQSGSAYAVQPGTVRKQDDTPYAVFTPFYKVWQTVGWPKPFDVPKTSWVSSNKVTCEGFPDEPECAATLPEASAAAALARWDEFSGRALDRYYDIRNNPDVDGTSMLSPYLRFGLVHPRTLLADLNDTKSQSHYRSELCWREFYADVLFHQPRTTWENLQPKMKAMKLDTGAKAKQRFDAWCKGETGYPIVDAGMKQLLATGWMHNRVRMIVASFLVKDLHLPWQWGAKFFMRHLVDGDIASNNHGWQWTAGTGTDAAPYFRIFNPVSQGEKFDPQGTFVRAWLPELADVATNVVHQPWELGMLNPYLPPIVDHAVEREESLARYKAVTGK